MNGRMDDEFCCQFLESLELASFFRIQIANFDFHACWQFFGRKGGVANGPHSEKEHKKTRSSGLTKAFYLTTDMAFGLMAHSTKPL